MKTLISTDILFGKTRCLLGVMTLTIVIFLSVSPVAFADPVRFTVMPSDIITSCLASGENYKSQFENVALRFSAERKRLIAELITILKNPKSSNLDQCAAAYYLGEMRAQEAVNYLADNITLGLDFDQLNLHSLPVLGENCASEALVKIGNPSFPALIRNLESNADHKVREASLKTLVSIEPDMDILKIRLTKALKLEIEVKKKENLAAALKELEK